MVGWHHLFNGRGFGQTPGEGEGQGGMLKSTGLQRVGHNWATEQQEEIGEKGGTEMGMGLRV